MAPELLTDQTDGIAVLTLNRPEARNALSGELVAALAEEVRRLDAAEDVGVVILTGADPAFCAGFDLRRLSTELRSVQQARQQGEAPHPGMLPEHETPLIAAVNGAAVTGGLELALGCDFMIASDRARFADTHARVGAMPGGGMTVRLPELIGSNRARQMSFTGDFIDAERAYEWGLVNEVVPHERLLPRAREVATAITSIPRAYVREVRRMYADMAALPVAEAWLEEQRRSRAWMAERFDQQRLSRERAAIIERARRDR